MGAPAPSGWSRLYGLARARPGAAITDRPSSPPGHFVSKVVDW
ncbi:hypothetical protein [Labrys miyagiensis]